MGSLLFYYSLVLGISLTEQALIPKRDNIVIIVNAAYKGFNGIETLISKLLHGISLLEYRISFHTSYGVSTKFYDFQSKECLLNQLRQRRNQRVPLLPLLQKSLQDLDENFANDKFYYLVINDGKNDNVGKLFLNTISNRKDCIQINVFDFGEQNNKTINPKQQDFSNLPYFQEKLSSCTANMTKGLDECNRECSCVNGEWSNCFRVRKEFSSLSYEERMRYINAYKDLSSSNQYERTYDNYCKYHHTYFKRGIHKRSQFFPWHRKYVLGFENMIRLIDCRITVPVWNWAQHSYHAWSITPNYHMWRENGGFGGNGMHKYSYCVKTGVFQSFKWKTPKYENSNVIDKISCGKHKHCGYKLQKDKRCLRRRFQCHTPRPKSVHYALNAFNVSSFGKFEREVRANWHNIVHHCTGGTMATNYASDTPEFWLHHGMLDSVWDKWQQKGDEYKFAGFQHSKKMTLLGFYPTEERYQFIDNINLGPCGIKIKYDKSVQDTMIYYQNNSDHHNDTHYHHDQHFHHDDRDSHHQNDRHPGHHHHHHHHSYHRRLQSHNKQVNNTNKPNNDTNTEKNKKIIQEFEHQSNFHYHRNNNIENPLKLVRYNQSEEQKLDGFHQLEESFPGINQVEEITTSNFVPNENDLILLKKQHDEHPQLRSDSGNIYDLMKKNHG